MSVSLKIKTSSQLFYIKTTVINTEINNAKTSHPHCCDKNHQFCNHFPESALQLFKYRLIYLKYTVPKYQAGQLASGQMFYVDRLHFQLCQLMASLSSNCADYNNEVFHRCRIIFCRNYFVIYCHQKSIKTSSHYLGIPRREIRIKLSLPHGSH